MKNKFTSIMKRIEAGPDGHLLSLICESNKTKEDLKIDCFL